MGSHPPPSRSGDLAHSAEPLVVPLPGKLKEGSSLRFCTRLFRAQALEEEAAREKKRGDRGRCPGPLQQRGPAPLKPPSAGLPSASARGDDRVTRPHKHEQKQRPLPACRSELQPFPSGLSGEPSIPSLLLTSAGFQGGDSRPHSNPSDGAVLLFICLTTGEKRIIPKLSPGVRISPFEVCSQQ